MKNKFIVTGGAGFIGSHITELLLAEGFEVVVIDNLKSGSKKNLEKSLLHENFDLIVEDITTIDLNHKCFYGVSYIIHLAGLGDVIPSIEFPIEYFRVNCYGTARLMEAAKVNNIKKIVYAASSSCYGLTEEPTNEKAPIATMHPYAFTKYLGELTLFHWAKVYGLHVNSIRIFNAYGTRSRTSGSYGAMFGVFLKQILSAQPLTIVGDGSQTRDFVYVTDVAKAFLLAAINKVHGEIFNIGSGDPKSIIEIVSFLDHHYTNIPDRPGEPRATWADISKARTMLGWTPTVDLSEGIKKMLSEIDYWKDAPLWTPESIIEASKNWFKYMDGQGTYVNPLGNY